VNSDSSSQNWTRFDTPAKPVSGSVTCPSISRHVRRPDKSVETAALQMADFDNCGVTVFNMKLENSMRIETVQFGGS